MGWIVRDYLCPCGKSYEDLVKSDSQKANCPECHKKNTPIISAPALGKFSMADADGKANILRTRSSEHTKREVRKEPERFGFEGKKRARRVK